MEYIYGINNVAPSCPVLHHSSPAGLCLLCLDDSSERKRPQFQFVHLSLSWPPDDLFLADNPNLYGRRPLTKGKIGCCCHKLQFFFTSKKKLQFFFCFVFLCSFCDWRLRPQIGAYMSIEQSQLPGLLKDLKDSHHY